MRDLVLLLINFMDEKAYVRMYVVSKRHRPTYSFERKVRIVRNWSRRKCKDWRKFVKFRLQY